MTKNNLRFAHYATRAPLVELQVESGTTIGALKGLAEQRLSNGDDLCPMRYFDQWYCEGKVGMTCIEERANGLMLSEAGFADESHLYLEGPFFTEGQADVGRAIAAVRAESKAANTQLAAQHAAQVQMLMDEVRSLRAATEVRLDSVVSSLKEFITDSQQRQAAATNKVADTLTRQGEAIKLVVRSSFTVHETEVDKLLLEHSNRPMRALSEALREKANPGIALPMAIIMDRRCGIERKVEKGDENRRHYEVGATPLMLAIYERRVDVAKALLAAGADPNAKVSTGDNSLSLELQGTVRKDDLESIESLISYGADINSANDEGKTPLHNAVGRGHKSLLEPLVRFGANLESVDDNGWTPLHNAASKGETGSIKALLKMGANQAAVDNEGRTPLHCAAQTGNIKAIEAFQFNVAAFEASLTAVDENGRTPLQEYVFIQKPGSSYNENKVRTLLTPK